jgi:peptide chain release factor 2
VQEGFWDNPQEAGEVMKKIEKLKSEIENWEKIKKEMEETEDFLREVEENGEEEKDSFDLIEKAIKSIQLKGNEYENQTLLSGTYDRNDAIVAIHSGAGGVDAQDWSEMLLRM